jgi:hypothetical protein
VISPTPRSQANNDAAGRGNSRVSAGRCGCPEHAQPGRADRSIKKETSIRRNDPPSARPAPCHARLAFSAGAYTLHCPRTPAARGRSMTMFDKHPGPTQSGLTPDRPPPQARPSAMLYHDDTPNKINGSGQTRPGRLNAKFKGRDR